MMRQLFFITILCLSNWVYAQTPVINDYHAVLSVYKNAEMTVTETINVTTDGKRIKRGIYRDIPTYYRTRQGADFNIGFQLLTVTRDGKDEPFFIKQQGNGLRIYVGSKNRLLPPGTYTYEITYSVDRAIGFFENHDELYWNVTGNGWSFPITKASALLVLPNETRVNKATAYTGDYGSRTGNVTITYPSQNEVKWVTLSPLNPQQGLTIVAAWPKGIISQPTLSTEIGYFARDNSSYILALAGLTIVFLFYLLAWYYMGRDPKTKTIIPLFEPPKDLSPQALRYIKKMRYDNKMFTAAIVNMAVKKHLTINHKKKKNYTLVKISDETSNLTPTEQALSRALFEKQSKLVISQDNQTIIAKAVKTFKKSLKKEFENKYFVRNSAVVIIGIIISLISLFPLFHQYSQFIAPMLIGAVFMVVLLQAIVSLHDNFNDYGISLKLLSTSGISIFVFVIFFIIFTQDILQGMILQLLVVAMFALVNTLFYYLMKRPTMIGAKAIQQAQGFERFLKATEEDRLNFRNPPNKTPELFEAFLPFALALGLEQAWSNQFASILANSQYQPTWYTGSHFGSFNASNFSDSVGSSLSSAISSASVAPGSSSGFGGGGFSGGGGGGGGGGGW